MRFERNFIVRFITAGAFTVETMVPGGDTRGELEAWLTYSNASGTPAFLTGGVYVFEGRLSTADCQQRVAVGGNVGPVDALLVIPIGGTAKRGLDLPGEMTIFCDQTPSFPVGVQLRATQK